MNPKDLTSFFNQKPHKPSKEIPIDSEKKSYKKPLSRNLEKIFREKILPSLFNAETFAFESSNYDDEKNRVDCFACLSFDQPIFDPESELNFSYIPIAFDLTVSSERKVILEKLVKTSRNPEPLPFGFTKSKHFKKTASSDISEEALVPRFVIGISDYDVETLARAIKNPESLPALKFRFKILSELKNELNFSLSMLPESFNTKISKKSAGLLNIFNKFLSASLEDCSMKLLDEEIIEIDDKTPKKIRSSLENLLIKESKAAFREEKQSRKLRPGYDRSRITDDDSYVQILTLADELLATAFDPSSKIASLRKITPRSSAL